LGFEQEWVNRKRGRVGFRLVVFRAQDAFPATWDNVFERAIPRLFAHSPRTLSRVLAHRAELQGSTYDEFVKKAAAEGLTHFRTGKDGHDRISLENFLALPDDKCTVIQCRRLLHSTLYLTALFAGTGYTMLENGSKGFAEVLVWSRPLEELPDLAAVDLTVR